jgi:hypothetical protein
MMQHLLTVAAHGGQPESAPARNVVTQEDALNAVLQVAAVIDSATQARLIPEDQGIHGVAMLMVVREYVKSLPPGITDDGSDRATTDLTELVELLRGAADSANIHG